MALLAEYQKINERTYVPPQAWYVRNIIEGGLNDENNEDNVSTGI